MSLELSADLGITAMKPALPGSLAEQPSPAKELAGLLFDESAHLYTLNGRRVPGVTSVLERVGLIDYGFLGERRDFYLTRGSAVHAACHYDDMGDLAEETVSAEILGYVNGWRKFRSDYGFVPDLIEQCVCNDVHGYAGTLDRTGAVRNGEEAIIDIKSGTAPAAVRYQLAAYAACLEHPRMRNRLCVELHGDATYRVIPFERSDYARDFAVFCAAVTVLRAMEER
jgi:hypothetical protein